jgi:hypothetical protein
MPPAFLQRVDSLVTYHFPDPQQDLIRCRGTQGWKTSTAVLQDVGLLRNAQACHVTAVHLHLHAELQGESDVQLETTQIILPSRVTVVTHSEKELLSKIMDERRLNEIISTVAAHKNELDVDTLLTLHTTDSLAMDNTDWIKIVYVCVPINLGLIIVYHCLHMYTKF